MKQIKGDSVDEKTKEEDSIFVLLDDVPMTNDGIKYGKIYYGQYPNGNGRCFYLKDKSSTRIYGHIIDTINFAKELEDEW